MSVKKKRTIGPCRGVTWLYYVVFLWSRDFFPPLYLDPRFRPLLLKYIYIYTILIDIESFLIGLLSQDQDREVRRSVFRHF